MKISIVTPNFNGAELLERAIQSVITQDYRNIEYIVMDGGSTDESVQIANRHRSHIASLFRRRTTASSTQSQKASRWLAGTSSAGSTATMSIFRGPCASWRAFSPTIRRFNGSWAFAASSAMEPFKAFPTSRPFHATLYAPEHFIRADWGASCKRDVSGGEASTRRWEASRQIGHSLAITSCGCDLLNTRSSS